MFETDEIKSGDIFVYDVGYSMELPHFIRVESVTPSGKSARVRELGVDCLPDDKHGFTGYKTPRIDEPIGDLITRRIKRVYDGGAGILVNGHIAFRWNGEPRRYDMMD